MSYQVEQTVNLFRGYIDVKPLEKQLEVINPFSSENDNGIRRSGNTTRLINKYIDYLFNHGVVIPIDHHYGQEFKKEFLLRNSELLLNKMLGRLKNELNCDVRPVESVIQGITLVKIENGFYAITLNK
jgi:hypothetical protein